jgi:hypothetical protein
MRRFLRLVGSARFLCPRGLLDLLMNISPYASSFFTATRGHDDAVPTLRFLLHPTSIKIQIKKRTRQIYSVCHIPTKVKSFPSKFKTSPTMRLVIFSLLFSLCQMASADTLHLRNGDRLSGVLLKLTADKVLLKTSYAGELEIELNAVAGIVTDKRIELKTKTGAVIVAQLGLAETAYVRLFDPSVNSSVDHSVDPSIDTSNKEAQGTVLALSELRYEQPATQAIASNNNKISNENSLHGRAELSLESLQNKTQTKHAEVDLNLNWQYHDWRHTVDIKRRSDSEDGEKIEDSQELEYSLDYFLTRNWFARANNFYQRDFVTNSSNIHYYGLGLGRNIWNDKNGSWEVMATYNKLFIGNAPLQFQLNTWLLSTEFKRKFENEKWDSYAKANVLFPQNIPINFIMQSEAGLRYQLNTNIYLSAKFMYDLYQSPSGSVKSHSYKIGLGTKW